MSKLFSSFNLQFTYIKNICSYLFFLITKILTDFRKTVETGMDPRLVSVPKLQIWNFHHHKIMAIY